jgi:hypothetical protein
VNDRLCLASSLPWPVAGTGRRIYITVHKMAGPLCVLRMQDFWPVYRIPVMCVTALFIYVYVQLGSASTIGQQDPVESIPTMLILNIQQWE